MLFLKTACLFFVGARRAPFGDVRLLAAAFSAPIFHKLGVGPDFCGKIAASFCETTQLMPALRCNLWQHPLAKSKSH